MPRLAAAGLTKRRRDRPARPPPRSRADAPQQRPDETDPPAPALDTPRVESTPAPLGRVLSPPQFWALMERWQVPDPLALELIEFPGKAPRAGKRPRFRFLTRQQRITHYLAEVEAVLAMLDCDRGWLHRPMRAAPFDGRTPIETIRRDPMAGSAAVLGFLHRTALRRTLAEPAPDRPS